MLANAKGTWNFCRYLSPKAKKTRQRGTREPACFTDVSFSLFLTFKQHLSPLHYLFLVLFLSLYLPSFRPPLCALTVGSWPLFHNPLGPRRLWSPLTWAVGFVVGLLGTALPLAAGVSLGSVLAEKNKQKNSYFFFTFKTKQKISVSTEKIDRRNQNNVLLVSWWAYYWYTAILMAQNLSTILDLSVYN